MIKINDIEYKFDDLTDKQKRYIEHITSLENKISELKFNLEQLEYSKKSFIDGLLENININKNKKGD